MTDEIKQEVWLGLKDISPLALGVFIYGLAFGLLASQAGMTSLDVGFMGSLVFAGSAQFAAVERLAAGAGATAALVAGLALNLRLFLLTAAVRDFFQGRPLWQKIFGAHMTSDENWALTLAKRGEGKDVAYWYLCAGGLFLLLAWVSSTVLGIFFANAIPEPKALGMDFAFTAAFIAIARSMWRDRSDLLPWSVSAVLVLGILGTGLLDASWALVIGGVGGAVTAGIRPS